MHAVNMNKKEWERWELAKNADNIASDQCFASRLLDLWEIVHRGYEPDSELVQNMRKEVSQTVKKVPKVNCIRGLPLDIPFTISHSKNIDEYRSPVYVLVECISFNVDVHGQPIHVDLTDDLMEVVENERKEKHTNNTKIYVYEEKQQPVADEIDLMKEKKDEGLLLNINHGNTEIHALVQEQRQGTNVMEVEENEHEGLLNYNDNAEIDIIVENQQPETYEMSAVEDKENQGSSTSNNTLVQELLTHVMEVEESEHESLLNDNCDNNKIHTIPNYDQDQDPEASMLGLHTSAHSDSLAFAEPQSLVDFVHVKLEPEESSATPSVNEAAVQIKHEPHESMVNSFIEESYNHEKLKYVPDKTMVASILDEIIYAAMEICDSQTLSRDEKFHQCMQKNNEMVGIKKCTGLTKFIVLENPGISTRRESCRMKSKGYRPDYAAFGGVSQANISDSSLKKKSVQKNNVKSSIDHCSNKNSAKRKRKTATKRNIPINIRLKLKKGQVSEPQTTPVYEVLTKKRKYKPWQGPKRKRKRKATKVDSSFNDKTNNSDKSKENIQIEKKRIKVNLKDHPEKYFEEETESTLMQDRGKPKEEKTVSYLVCALCKSYRTTQRNFLENHLEIHLNGDYDCKQCDAKFTNRYEWIKHRFAYHTSSYKFQCSVCSNKFGWLNGLKKHLTIEHGYAGTFCNICLSQCESVTTFLNRSEYTTHLLSQHPDQTEKCQNCGKCIWKKRLNFHIAHRCNTTVKVIPCHICGKEVVECSLKGHIKSHASERQFKCTACNYMAKTESRLRNHIMAKHEEKRLFHCDQCKYSCVQISQLHSHKKTHTGEKPYKCDQCAFAAAWNVQLKEHKKLHGLPICGTCDQCGVLMKKKMLELHKKKKHGGEP